MERQEWQFGLQFLFFVTTSLAISAWLLSLGKVSPFLPLVGIGLAGYWISRTLDAVRELAPNSIRWLLTFWSVVLYGSGFAAIILGVLFFTIDTLQSLRLGAK